MDAGVIARLLQRLGPLPRHRRGLIDLEHRALPFALMRKLRPRLESELADDLRRAKMLELRGVGARLRGSVYEGDGAIEVTVMIGGDVGDEVGGLEAAHRASTDFQRWHSLTSEECVETLRMAGVPEFSEKRDRALHGSHWFSERRFHPRRTKRRVPRARGAELRVRQLCRLHQLFVELESAREQHRKVVLAQPCRSTEMIDPGQARVHHGEHHPHDLVDEKRCEHNIREAGNPVSGIQLPDDPVGQSRPLSGRDAEKIRSDDERVRKLFTDSALALELGARVHVHRRSRVVLLVITAPPVKNRIGRNVEESHASFAAARGKRAGQLGVDASRQLGIAFASVNVGHRSAVEHPVRTNRLQDFARRSAGRKIGRHRFDTVANNWGIVKYAGNLAAGVNGFEECIGAKEPAGSGN